MKKLLLVLGLVTGIFAITHAQTPVVKERQVNQNQRINQGIRSGELTRAEAKRLKAEQRHIQQEKQMAKADGVVTRRERKHIKREQRQASRDIYRQKNDPQSRN